MEHPWTMMAVLTLPNGCGRRLYLISEWPKRRKLYRGHDNDAKPRSVSGSEGRGPNAASRADPATTPQPIPARTQPPALAEAGTNTRIAFAICPRTAASWEHNLGGVTRPLR